MKKPGKSANYDFKQAKPDVRMGQRSFANLPEKPILKPFGPPIYRDGIVNSFSASIDDLSGMDENER